MVNRSKRPINAGKKLMLNAEVSPVISMTPEKTKERTEKFLKAVSLLNPRPKTSGIATVRGATRPATTRCIVP